VLQIWPGHSEPHDPNSIFVSSPSDEPAPQEVDSPTLDAASVLAASVNTETAREDTDLELLELLKSTILRVDASDGAWEMAAVAIKKLAASRAESRMSN
jgi:hypothetical protein